MSARVILNREDGQIVFPLSEYDLVASAADINVLNQALYLRIQVCMNRRGESFEAGRTEPGPPMDDRDFGIWFEPGVRTWAWKRPPDPVAEALNADAEAGGEKWSAALSECNDEAENDPNAAAFIPTQADIADSLALRLATDAIRAASLDPAWATVRREWAECLADNGLDALTGENDWMSRQSRDALNADAPLDELMRLATTEAQCNNDVGLTQSAGDIVASYQAPLIDINQAALEEEKAQKQAYLSAARNYIARNQ